MFPSNYLSPVPRQGLPGHGFTYLSPLRSPSPLLISIPIPRLRVSDKHATFVWNASIVLADMIANDDGKEDGGIVRVEGRRVLEIGCGVGLPSVVAVRKRAKQVVLSDYDDLEMLDELKASLDEALVSTDLARVHDVGHTFGASVDPLLEPVPRGVGYDVILVGDCIWDRALHRPLLDSLVSILSACSTETTVHLTAGFHTGRAVVAEFLELACQRGLALVSRPKEVSVEGDEREWPDPRNAKFGSAFTRGGEERQEERNRWTLVAAFILERSTL